MLGTRPEAIKLWPIILETQYRNLSHIIISTGQQGNLLRDTLDELGIAPTYSLSPNLKALDSISFFRETIGSVHEILSKFAPSATIVQGDTNSAVIGALSSYSLKIPIGHVEAGLRSGDIYAPFPEEGNRKIIDSISTFLWLPTSNNQILDISENQKVSIVGNTIVDALRILTTDESISSRTMRGAGKILVTMHRRENFGTSMVGAMKRLVDLSKIVSNEIIFIKHPNPKVSEAIEESRLEESRIEIIEPLGYKSLINALLDCSILITDSGGLQEEATTLGVPLLVVRDRTERKEALANPKFSALVGSDGGDLVTKALSFLGAHEERSWKVKLQNHFGDGFASARIVSDLETELRD